MSILDNYPGAKTNSGILQFLINRIPHHERYFELFAGSASLYFAKKLALQNVIMDRDEEVYRALGTKLSEGYPYKYIHETPASSTTELSCRDAQQWLWDNTDELRWPDFIYLDPPYPFLSRRSGKSYYRHEMTNDDHVQLLTTIRTVKAKIMISTRQNDLYDEYLYDWRKDVFKTVDRAGRAEEIIYMNYPVPDLLHQYDYVGQNFSDRQRIRRKVSRFSNKIQDLPPYERHLLIQEMIKEDPAAVKHFLAMSPVTH